MHKAVFLDRDGVINIKKEEGYVLSYDEFFFLPAVKEAIKLLKDSNFKVIVITNQSVIGRGMMTKEALENIHDCMRAELRAYGTDVDAIYYCPHHPDDGCSCRKPKPGLILQAAKDHNIDLKQSYMIGDEEKDIEAGKAAGCQTFKVNEKLSLLEIVLKILRYTDTAVAQIPIDHEDIRSFR